MTYGSKTKNHSVAAQWQWTPGGATTASAKFLGFWKDDQPYLPSDRLPEPGYINWWKWADYGIGGAFPYLDAQKANRQTIQADVSHYADGFLGTHDIKFGVQYTQGRGNRLEGYFQNYANFLYPYRWTQNVSEMQSVRRYRPALLQQQVRDESVPDRAHRRLDRPLRGRSAGR
jgi:hypothetical protein